MPNFYSLGAVCLGAASRILKSKLEKTAAAVVVGVGLLVGSTGDVKAACDPPVYDVCFHKKSGNWRTGGFVGLAIRFRDPSTELTQLYEFQWNGLKRIVVDGVLQDTYESVSYYAPRLGPIGYGKFWWDPSTPWNNYGLSIYEGHFERNRWVRGTQVAQVDFYAYQEAALVYLNTSAASFSLSQYYCTIDYAPSLSAPYLLHGYTEGYFEGPFSGGTYRYHGDPGSPRFHYESDCSVLVGPPPRTSRNTRRPTPYRPR